MHLLCCVIASEVGGPWCEPMPLLQCSGKQMVQPLWSQALTLVSSCLCHLILCTLHTLYTIYFMYSLSVPLVMLLPMAEELPILFSGGACQAEAAGTPPCRCHALRASGTAQHLQRGNLNLKTLKELAPGHGQMSPCTPITV